MVILPVLLFPWRSFMPLRRPFRARRLRRRHGRRAHPGRHLRDHQSVIDTHDVVLRYLCSRPGDISRKDVDAISIAGASRNVIADRCSATWSVDEALSPSGAIAGITVQWCLIAEGLNESVHKKGPHGY
jgi:hypothetical protein